VARMLIVEEESRQGHHWVRRLQSQGHTVVLADGPTEAKARVRESCFDVVVLGRGGCGTSAGADPDLLSWLRRELPEAAVMIAGIGELGSTLAEEAASLASSDSEGPSTQRSVPVAPSDPQPASAGVHAVSAFSTIIGRSRPMRDLLRLVGRVAETDSTALVTGETGTGKELVGRAIHQASRRRDRVFCAINSASFPETLLESELFGHRRGAFTGASANKKGLFEHADQGTVFLDEVAEMPLSMQAKLLRFLQTGEVRPVGGESPLYVDVRLVTATNKDLEEEVRAGRFREDLYYRLAVIPIHLPPLRDRVEDIEPLAHAFLKRFAARMGKNVEAIDPAALAVLRDYHWPGNVRQLENTIESGVALCQGTILHADDFPIRLQGSRAVAVESSDTLQSLETLERTHILRTLERVGGNRRRAAEILRISTTTLWRRLKEFEMDRTALPVGRL